MKTRQIIIVTKIKEGFLNKKERVKGFFIFITMQSFKQVECNYSKKEPCKWQGFPFWGESPSSAKNVLIPPT